MNGLMATADISIAAAAAIVPPINPALCELVWGEGRGSPQNIGDVSGGDNIGRDVLATDGLCTELMRSRRCPYTRNKTDWIEYTKYAHI